MKILVKHPRIIDHKLYPAGEYVLPDALADHWFVKGLVKDGDISILAELKAVAPEAEEVEEAISFPQPHKKRRG